MLWEWGDLQEGGKWGLHLVRGAMQWWKCASKSRFEMRGKWIKSMDRMLRGADQTCPSKGYSINWYVRRPAVDTNEETLHRHWRSFGIFSRRHIWCARILAFIVINYFRSFVVLREGCAQLSTWELEICRGRWGRCWRRVFITSKFPWVHLRYEGGDFINLARSTKSFEVSLFSEFAKQVVAHNPDIAESGKPMEEQKFTEEKICYPGKNSQFVRGNDQYCRPQALVSTL